MGYHQKQHGAAEARRAHNPEGPRSKRGVAITRGSNPPSALYFFLSWEVYMVHWVQKFVYCWVLGGSWFRVIILPASVTLIIFQVEIVPVNEIFK